MSVRLLALAGIVTLKSFALAGAADGTVKARPLPLSSVRLTGGPLKQAQDLNAAYLLALEPNRMMAYLRKEAGLAENPPGTDRRYSFIRCCLPDF